LFAASLQLDGLPDRAESESAGHAVVEQVDVIILEFNDLAAIDADEVIVTGLFEVIRVVGLQVTTQIDFLDQSGFNQQGDGPVDGGPGGIQVVLSHAVEELLGGEMVIRGEGQAHNRVPLGGAAQSLLPNEGIKFGHCSFVHVPESIGSGGRGEAFPPSRAFPIGKRCGVG